MNDLKSLLADADEDLAGSPSSFLKVDGKTGDWTCNRAALAPMTKVVPNPATYMRCVLSFPARGGKPTRRSAQGVRESDLRKGEQLAASVEGVMFEDGQAFFFETTSQSGRRALAALVKAYVHKEHEYPGQVPVVEISSAPFESEQYGTLFRPVFHVGKNWIPSPFPPLRSDDQLGPDVEASTFASLEDFEAALPAAPRSRDDLDDDIPF